jgi:hypothetical protein
MLGLQIAFAVCLLIVLVGGYFTFKNFDKWFGSRSDVPSETESSLLLNKAQAFIIWALAVKLCVMMIWIL